MSSSQQPSTTNDGNDFLLADNETNEVIQFHIAGTTREAYIRRLVTFFVWLAMFMEVPYRAQHNKHVESLVPWKPQRSSSSSEGIK